jgi:hypothetical protein
LSIGELRQYGSSINNLVGGAGGGFYQNLEEQEENDAEEANFPDMTPDGRHCMIKRIQHLDNEDSILPFKHRKRLQAFTHQLEQMRQVSYQAKKGSGPGHK